MNRLSAFVLTLAIAFAPAAHAQDASPSGRSALAHRAYDQALTAMSSGAGTAADVYTWSVRWMRADLEARVPDATQAHLVRMTNLAAQVHTGVTTGMLRASAETEAQYYVAEARAWLTHPPVVP